MIRILPDHRVFTATDQERFAELSGDCNPIHMDAVLARREMFGDVVVHGLHLVLSLLDPYCAALDPHPRRLVNLQARFPGSAYLNRTIEYFCKEETGDGAKLTAVTEKQPVAEITFIWIKNREASGQAGKGWETMLPTFPRRPVERLWDQLSGLGGELPLGMDTTLLATLFPALHTRLPLRIQAELLALTRLVGMTCPGLRFVFSAFEMEWSDVPLFSPDPPLFYEVTRADARVSLVRMGI